LFIFVVIMAERVRPGVCHQSQAACGPPFYWLAKAFFNLLPQRKSLLPLDNLTTETGKPPLFHCLFTNFLVKTAFPN
jgi:hypothetical protein